MRQLTFQRVIGSGAVGTVYLAELVGSRGFRRTVAVKVLLTNQPDQEMFLSRVRDEARLLGLLHDEHILRVLELVRIGERDGVVMEYVEGVDLAALVSEGNRPPARWPSSGAPSPARSTRPTPRATPPAASPSTSFTAT